MTLAALEAGKHVYSEKPLALTSGDARVIAERADRSGRVVVAAPCVLLPQVRRAREILESGELGSMLTARGHGPERRAAVGGVPLGSVAVLRPGGRPTGRHGRVPAACADRPPRSSTEVAAFSAKTRDSFDIKEPFAGRSISVETADAWHLVLRLADGVLASVEANNCAAGAMGPTAS